MSSSEIPADFPDGVVPLELWTRAGIACAVGSIGGSLYGLVRAAGLHTGWTRYRPERELSAAEVQTLTPQNLGAWVAFPVAPVSRYWSNEVLARFVTEGSPDLAAWDQCGHVWAFEKIRRDVGDFVDAAVRSSVPAPRRPPTPSSEAVQDTCEDMA